MRREFTAYQMDTANETPSCAGGTFSIGPGAKKKRKPKKGKTKGARKAAGRKASKRKK